MAGGDLALTHKKRSARAQLEMHRLYYFLLQKLKEIAMKKTLITLAVLAAATGVAKLNRALLSTVPLTLVSSASAAALTVTLTNWTAAWLRHRVWASKVLKIWAAPVGTVPVGSGFQR